MLRIVEELKSSVSEKLEDLVQDESSHLSKLDKVWEQVVKSIIIKELVDHWREVAKLGRTLEDAARYWGGTCTFNALHASLSGLRVMGPNATNAISEVQ